MHSGKAVVSETEEVRRAKNKLLDFFNIHRILRRKFVPLIRVLLLRTTVMFGGVCGRTIQTT